MHTEPSKAKHRTCIHCKFKIAPDAVICVTCGTDQRTGNQLTNTLPGADAEPVALASTVVTAAPENKSTLSPDDDTIVTADQKQRRSPDGCLGYSIGFVGAGLPMGVVIAQALSRQGNINTVIGAGSLLFLAMLIAFGAGRRHIGFGILTVLGIVVATPLLVLGACFAAASGCR